MADQSVGIAVQILQDDRSGLERCGSAARGRAGRLAQVLVIALQVGEPEQSTQLAERGPAAFEAFHSLVLRIHPPVGGQGLAGLSEQADLGPRARPWQAAVPFDGELPATAVAGKMRQGERIGQVLAPLALQDPQQQGRQIEADVGVGAGLAQQFAQAAAQLAAADAAARQSVAAVEEFVADRSEEMVLAEQVGDAPLAAGGDRLGPGPAEAAHQSGASLAVDGTLAPALATCALDHGADIVFHSMTKHINGHSDALGGALIARSDDERWKEIRTVRTLTGGIQDPFSCWMALRGLRTLALRFGTACENALCFAEHFHRDPRITRVHYPGLPDHPSHEIARKQMRAGFGAMVSVCVAGDADAARRVAASTRVFLPATSLGGVESLIEHRRSVESPNSIVDPTLLRLSIGIEHVNDLIADFDQALSASKG